MDKDVLDPRHSRIRATPDPSASSILRAAAAVKNYRAARGPFGEANW